MMNKNKVTAILDKTIEWALYLLVFFAPLSKSIIEICITIASVAWISKKILLRDYSLKKTPLNIALFAIFIISAMSIINSDFKMLAMRSLISKCLEYILLYFIIVETMDSEAKFKNVLKIAFASAVIVTIDAYLQYYLFHKDIFRSYASFKYNPQTSPGFLGFPTGPFPFPNDLSAWMLIILVPVLSFFAWGQEKLRTRCIIGLFLFPFLFLFYLTNNRSAWLGFFVSFFLMLLIKGKKAVILLLILAILITLPFLTKEKMRDIFGFSSMQDRFYMWRIGWKIFAEHPIVGNGINMFYSKFREYREDEVKGQLGSYAHNGFLQMAAEIGTIGLMVFLLLIFRVFYGAFRYIVSGSPHQALVLGLAGGILAFLVQSFFDTNLQSLPLAALFWFNLSFLTALQNLYERNI